MRIMVSIRTDKIGSECEGILEIDDEATEGMSDDDIEREARDFAFNMIEWNWKKL